MILTVLATPAAARPAPAWSGVWRGTIGHLPVMACLQHEDYEDFGAYYYLSHLTIISLGAITTPPAKPGQTWTENRFADNPGKGPLWRVEQVDARRLSGEWSEGKRALPIRLAAVAMEKPDKAGDDQPPCGSLAFNLPRYRPPRILRKPATLDGATYTRLIATTSMAPAGDDSGDIESFALNAGTPAIGKINTELAHDLPTDLHHDLKFICSMNALGTNGLDGEASTSTRPVIITRQWMVTATDAQDSCGGAHPNSSETFTTWNLHEGKMVDLDQWFNAAALTRTTKGAGRDAYTEVTYAPAFHKLLVAAYENMRGDDKECAEAVEQSEVWPAHLDRDGIAFVPDFPHVIQACTDSAVIPFSRLAPYLSPAGRAGVASFMGDVRALPPSYARTRKPA